MKDEKQVVGNSLIQCIHDILIVKVIFTDVMMIITGTAIPSHNALMNVVDSYMKSYWNGHNRKLCIELIEYFLYRGMIRQPRLGNSMYYGCNHFCKDVWIPWEENDEAIPDIVGGYYTCPISGLIINEDDRIDSLTSDRNIAIKDKLAAKIEANIVLNVTLNQ